jgi:seryl-tRNA synthetase
MLDIQFIRDNPELVAEKSKQKGYEVDIPQLLGFDDKRRQLLQTVEELRRQRNDLNTQNNGQKPSEAQLSAGRKIKEQLGDLEHQLNAVDKEFQTLLKKVPNMPESDVPVGASEDENVVSKEWGTKPSFDFEPKNHWEIGETRDLIDKERAAKVTGSRFAYIKGDLVKLQFAIIQFVLTSLTDERLIARLIEENNLKLTPKAFIPILPPVMIREDIYDEMDRLEPREDRYHIEGEDDNLWLIGSAEHTLGSMYAGEILPESELPLRYIGYSTSFRQEAGTYGKDTQGILRMHQFDKLEMETFSTPETSRDEHLLMIAIQEYLVQQLELPYHVLMKCTADIGKPDARGVDIEAWLPGQNAYRETHTADYMTDYQSRRLKTRLRRQDGSTELIHTNDATAFAMGRTMIAIMENYQTAEGKVRVPAVLQPYMGGQTEF